MTVDEVAAHAAKLGFEDFKVELGEDVSENGAMLLTTTWSMRRGELEWAYRADYLTEEQRRDGMSNVLVHATVLTSAIWAELEAEEVSGG